MKKFDNVEMMEEELDNVAGGQKTATIEHSEGGHTSYRLWILKRMRLKQKRMWAY